ncbi:hypothetical protein [Stakelama marina]|uniref:Uncharacterized protein n=1 Tax=Stakelama marina TaxID=2826939 RepID=A0A8T4IAV7_9SPHN|nr:hypothetical protein [Stakelama marina]MBR0551797.1 hypothetical protein [Stakelama marina]
MANSQITVLTEWYQQFLDRFCAEFDNERYQHFIRNIGEEFLMARRPYLFCRYQIEADGQILDESGQLSFLAENQGQRMEHPTRGERPNANALLMEVDPFEADGLNAVEFYIGYQPGYRTKSGYDSRKQKRTTNVVPDDHIKSAHIIAVPTLGCMAIEDRTGEHNIPQRVAAKALGSIAKSVFDDAEVSVIHLSDAEAREVCPSSEHLAQLAA